MPEIDFTEVPDAEDYSPLPDGEYLCEVQNAKIRSSRAGDDFCPLEFVVIQEGRYTGRKIFDNLLWHTDGTKQRAKLILKRLGFDVSGKLKFKPDELQGRRVWITLKGTRTYTDGDGEERVQNVVPFAGYRKLDGDESGESKEDLPF